MQVRSLSVLECTRLLTEHRLGRLACVDNMRPYVVPVFFAYADNCLHAFSMPGRKIDAMRTNPQVCVLVEEHGAGRDWRSVVVEGRYEELPDKIGHKRERDHTWSLLSRHFDWWEPGALKPVTASVSDHLDHIFFRIHVEQLSGREARDM